MIEYLFFYLNGDKFGHVMTKYIKNTGNPIWDQDSCLKSENKVILQLEICDDDYSIKYLDLIEILLKSYKIGCVYDYNSNIKLNKKIQVAFTLNVNY